MDPATVENYLTYIPLPIVKSEYFSSSVKTINPAHPQDLEGVEICAWKSFVDTVEMERKKALEFKSDRKLLPLAEEEKETSDCENEAQVEDELSSRLFVPLGRLMRFLGVAGKFRRKPCDVILDPDFAWATKMVKENESAGKIELQCFPHSATASDGRLVSKILIEVKTFWAFDVPDDLVSILKVEMSLPKSQAEESSSPARRLKVDHEDTGTKVVSAVSQIYGYMSVNHLTYGVLATFNTFFFLRRVVAESGCRLEITDAIKRDQTRRTHKFTLMEAWLCLIKIGEEDHLFTSPYSSPDPKQRVLKTKRRVELVEIAKIGNSFFGRNKTRCQLGTVVEGGLWGKDAKNSIMKVVDTSKSSEMTEKLKLEASVYKTLASFQGTVVPYVHGFFLINSWILILVLSNCGDRITGKHLVKYYDDILATVKQIHEAGVAHGDLAYQNILLNTEGKLTIIDFSDAKLRSSCNEDEFLLHCKNDFNTLRRLLDQAKEDLTGCK